jgi:hypothetical protein
MVIFLSMSFGLLSYIAIPVLLYFAIPLFLQFFPPQYDVDGNALSSF